MLRALSITGFKSLARVERLELAPLTIFFGPNAAGKSNLLDTLMVLSRLATAQTLADAIGGPVRGTPPELFTFPQGGLPAILQEEHAQFRIEADMDRPRTPGGLRYACEISVRPSSGTLSLSDEFLARLTLRGKLQGNPVIEKDVRSGKLRIRRKSKPAHPWEEEVGLNHTLLSNKRYSGKEYAAIDEARAELTSYRSYYLDPRVAMRSSQSPRDVNDIGPLGEHLAPYLFRLRADHPRVFEGVRRTLRSIIPSVDDLIVDLDEKRGIVSVEIRQGDTPFSLRVLSEGTLRVLALISVALNPWRGTLVAFEEPENGVHPRRLELITDLFAAMALGRERHRQQVILTTHSPAFCASILRLAREKPGEIRMYRAVRKGLHTAFELFDPLGPLFSDVEIRNALTTPSEDGMFEALMMRGLIDG